MFAYVVVLHHNGWILHIILDCTVHQTVPFRNTCHFASPFLQPTPTSRFVKGYVGAVSTAVGIAVSAELLLCGSTVSQ